MNAHEIRFEKLEILAVLVKKAKFSNFVKTKDITFDINAPFDHVDFVFSKFLEAWSVGDFESLFVVWGSGLEWMRGKNLVEGCFELTL